MNRTATLSAAHPRTGAFPLWTMLAVWRERRALARLTARELRDLGLDAEAARREAARPFWDLPRGRLSR